MSVPSFTYTYTKHAPWASRHAKMWEAQSLCSKHWHSSQSDKIHMQTSKIQKSQFERYSRHTRHSAPWKQWCQCMGKCVFDLGLVAWELLGELSLPENPRPWLLAGGSSACWWGSLLCKWGSGLSLVTQQNPPCFSFSPLPISKQYDHTSFEEPWTVWSPV